MTKAEFLEKLRSSLGNDLNRTVVQENVDYYNSYIDDEIRKGRSEAEVIAELGDPWAIAQTIIDGEESGRSRGNVQNTYEDASYRYGTGYDAGTGYRTGYDAGTGYGGSEYGYNSGNEAGYDDRSDNQYRGSNVHVFGLDSWWQKLLLILSIVGIIVLVVAIVGGLLSLLAPILVPLFLFMLIVRLLGGSRRW